MLKRVLTMSAATVIFTISVLMMQLIPSTVRAQQEPEPTASASSMVSPYEAICAACHDNRSTESLAPSRQALRQMDPERVLAALTEGPMAAFATGYDGSKLREDELRAMAELVTGKPFGSTADRTAAAMSNQCSAPLTLDDPFEKPRWNGWTPDPTRAYRFQPKEAGGLTGADLPKLKLKWAFAFPGAASAAWAQPTVVGGTVFIGSDNNHVYGIDAMTGCVYWSYEAHGQVRTAVSIGEITEIPGVRYAAYFGDYMGYVTAVNAETGEELWTLLPDDHQAAKITGPPTLDPSPGGHLYVGVSSWEQMPGRRITYECCKFQGSLTAIDVNTGRPVWKTYTMAERPRPLRRNSAGTQLYGPAGAAIWNAPTLDLKLRKVYVGAGTCYISEFFEQKVGFDGGACVSVMAFDMDTGAREWWTQLVSMDRHPGGCGAEPEELRLNCPGYVDDPDDDPSGAPVLYTASDGSRMIIQGQESGRITALDPDDNGAILWVAQAGDKMAAMNGGFGGAFDGEKYFKPLPFKDGTGSIAAIRVADGSRAWYTTLEKPDDCDDSKAYECSSANWSSASAVPGAVLTGSWDGVVRGYSADTGAILWEYATKQRYEAVNGVPAFGGGIGGGSPTIVDGMLFVGSGYAILGGSPGNVLLAFGLD